MARILPPLLASIALALALAGPSTASTGAGTLLRLTTGSVCSERAALLAAGAREIDAQLRLWRLDARRAASVLPGLRARGAVAFAHREQSYRVAATSETPDPLQADEWWLAQIGLEGQTAPGPGMPVTIVDSGLDFTHPEFAGRADTLALNAQEPAPLGGEHGTSVASVIGAPAQRRRARRDLPAGRPALLGRRQGLRHAAGVERDRRRHPRRRAGRQERHQPEPRLRHP